MISRAYLSKSLQLTLIRPTYIVRSNVKVNLPIRRNLSTNSHTKDNKPKFESAGSVLGKRILAVFGAASIIAFSVSETVSL